MKSNDIKKQLIEMIKKMPEESAWDLLNTLSGEAIDQRAFPRIKSAITTEFKTQDRVRCGLIKDICAGGVFIETREQATVGNEITLVFTPENGSEAVKITGTVVRAAAGGIAVKFYQHAPELISDTNP